jgi:hypothetical protein
MDTMMTTYQHIGTAELFVQHSPTTVARCIMAGITGGIAIGKIRKQVPPRRGT